MLKNILFAGVKEEQTEALQRRVRLSNIVILLLIFSAALPFAVISFFYFPKLTFIPILGAVACVMALIMNYAGGITSSRVFISIVAIISASSFNYILSGENDPPIPSLLVLQMSFTLVLFVLFDYNEKNKIIPLMILGILSIVGFPYFKTIYTIEYDQAILREGWISNISMFFAVITGQFAIISLAYQNWQGETKTAAMVSSLEEQNKSLAASENQMKENIKLLEKAKEEERKRNWITEGLANIADILRNSSSENLFDHLISGIVKYVNVNQGGLFITEDNEDGYNEKTKKKLALKACYAYSRKKYIDRIFLPGQGLVGQAYLEKSYIYLTEVPQDYVRITSGLGDENPKSVIVLPLVLNDFVEGVLELASFKTFERHEIEFLQKACETMASYIRNDRINTHTKKLLEDTMNNSEEMRAQEEELRQNHEELMATQEEMRRQNEELLKLKENLEEEVRKQTLELETKNKEILGKAIEQGKENEQTKRTYETEIKKMLALWMSHLNAAEKLVQENSVENKTV